MVRWGEVGLVPLDVFGRLFYKWRGFEAVGVDDALADTLALEPAHPRMPLLGLTGGICAPND